MRKMLSLALCILCSILSKAQWVNAGPDQTIYEGQVVQLLGSAFNVPQTRWLTNGTGVFGNQFALQTTYTPSATDITNGIVTLTLRDRFNPSIKDKMRLRFKKCPTVNIEMDSDTICGWDEGGDYSLAAVVTGTGVFIQWTSSGDGYFDDEYSDVVTYHFTTSEAGAGKVWLYVTVTDTVNGCAPVKDSFYLKLNDPARIESVSATPSTLCGTVPVQLSSQTSGTTSTIFWTTNGTGTITPNPAKNTVYTPSQQDLEMGYVEFYSVSNDPPGPCPAVYGETMSIEFNIGIIDLGPDTVICANPLGDTIKLSSRPNEHIDSVLWSHNGTGYFNNPKKFFPYYVYTPADVVNGTIRMTCVGYGVCGLVYDTMYISLIEQPWLEFPVEVLFACRDEKTIPVSVIIHGGATGGTWTSTGYGLFGNPNATNTKYTPSLWDVYEGCIQLYFTTDQSSRPCEPATGYMTLCFDDCKSEMEGNDLLFSNNQKSKLYLTPNPVTDWVYIHGAERKTFQYELVNDIGVKERMKWLSSSVLDVSSLRPGLYYIIAIDKDGSKARLRFIRQ
jgi:hypothetical protein